MGLFKTFTAYFIAIYLFLQLSRYRCSSRSSSPKFVGNIHDSIDSACPPKMKNFAKKMTSLFIFENAEKSAKICDRLKLANFRAKEKI